MAPSKQRSDEIDDDAKAAADLADKVVGDIAADNERAAKEREEAEAQALRDSRPTPPPGSITVDVNSNLALATGEILTVNQKGAKVADTAETRALIAAGHLTEKGAKD